MVASSGKMSNTRRLGRHLTQAGKASNARRLGRHLMREGWEGI